MPTTNMAPGKPTVTPYLPPEAENIARAWMSAQGKPALVIDFEQHLDACPNCQGNLVVYICLVESGPYKLPPATKSVIRWFEGNERFGKGWCIIKSTNAYPCPECAKAQLSWDSNPIAGEKLSALLRDHRPMIQALAARMSK